MQHFVIRETACTLQAKWEKDVLLEVQGVTDDQDMGQLMMGANGFAANYIQGPAAPFITKGYKKGYFPKLHFQCNLPSMPLRTNLPRR